MSRNPSFQSNGSPAIGSHIAGSSANRGGSTIEDQHLYDSDDDYFLQKQSYNIVYLHADVLVKENKDGELKPMTYLETLSTEDMY